MAVEFLFQLLMFDIYYCIVGIIKTIVIQAIKDPAIKGFWALYQ